MRSSVSQVNVNVSARTGYQRSGWYLAVAVGLLLIAAFFRLWALGSVPPGMSTEELNNAQISDRLRHGDVSVIYDEVTPAREGLYYAILALSSSLTGRGLILWRLPTSWLSMLSLAMTAQVMRRLFGGRVSLMTLGLMAVTFWPVWMGRTIQNVALVPLMTSLVVYFLVRALEAQERTESSLWFTIGGLALGVAQYVHVTAWTLIVLFLVFIVYYRVVDKEAMRYHRANIIYTLSLTTVLCLPLMIYIARHPGVREPVPLAEQPGLVAEVPGRLASSLAALVLRGDMLPTHNLPGHPVLGPFISILLIIGIGYAVARWRRPAYVFSLLWLIIGLLPAAFLPLEPDFEFMAVVLPIIFVFPAIGLRAVFRVVQYQVVGRVQVWLLAAISCIVMYLVAAGAVLTYRDFFLVWPSLGDMRLNYQADLGVLARYLDTTDDPSPVSICSSPIDRASAPFALTNAELLTYLMHRHDLPIRYFDCTQALVLADGGASQRIIFPRGHYYDHLPGPLLAWMRTAEDERVPDIRPDVVMRLEVSDDIAAVAGAFTTIPLVVWPPEASAEGLADLPVTFGHNVTFLGYAIRDESIGPSDWVELSSYWRIDGPPPSDIVVFAHMLSNPELILAQRDVLGVDINTLQVRDIFIQYTLIQTPSGTADGAYPLSVGVYYPGTGERLPVFEEGEIRAERLFLRSIIVKR